MPGSDISEMLGSQQMRILQHTTLLLTECKLLDGKKCLMSGSCGGTPLGQDTAVGSLCSWKRRVNTLTSPLTFLSCRSESCKSMAGVILEPLFPLRAQASLLQGRPCKIVPCKHIYGNFEQWAITYAGKSYCMAGGVCLCVQVQFF